MTLKMTCYDFDCGYAHHCESGEIHQKMKFSMRALTRIKQRRRFLKMNQLNINKDTMEHIETDKCPRSEKSLSTLTKKFVEMLQAENVLDLNVVSETICFQNIDLGLF